MCVTRAVVSPTATHDHQLPICGLSIDSLVERGPTPQLMKVVLQLFGGLGNQMFQYAAARALASRNNAELALDTWSGFVRDKQYRRNYELGSLQISARRAEPVERIPFWLDRVSNTALRHLPRLDRTPRPPRLVSGRNLREPAPHFFPSVLDTPLTRDTWMTGYWQSPRYFDGIKEQIVEEFRPPTPTLPKVLELGIRMKRRPSVAVCIRLYEESLSPGGQSSDGSLKTVQDVNIAIMKMVELVPNADWYVFCTHRAEFLRNLTGAANCTLITADGGFGGTLDSLWMMAQCQHHILTNSTYYWWGAWLAENIGNSCEHHIFAADNFINRDSLPAHWQTF